MLGVVRAIFALTGPGAYSLDAVLGWSAFGPGWFAAATVGGLAAGVLVLSLRRRAPGVVETQDMPEASTGDERAA